MAAGPTATGIGDVRVESPIAVDTLEHRLPLHVTLADEQGRDYERLSETLDGLPDVVFSLLMLRKATPLFEWGS